MSTVGETPNTILESSRWAFFVLAIGAAVPRLANLAFSSPSADLSVSLVREYLPLSVVVSVLLVLSALRHDDTDIAHPINLSILAGVGVAFALLVSLASLVIRVTNTGTRSWLMVIVFVFVFLTVLLFGQVFGLAHRAQLLCASGLLVMPALVNEFLFRAWTPTLVGGAAILTIGQFLAVMTAVLGTRFTPNRQQPAPPHVVQFPLGKFVLAVSTFALMAASQVPVGFSAVQKVRYLSTMSGARAPLFAVSTLLLLVIPSTLGRSTSGVIKVVQQRRIGLLALVIGICGSVGHIVLTMAEGSSRNALFWASTTCSLLLAVQLPWIAAQLIGSRTDWLGAGLNILSVGLLTVGRSDNLEEWQLKAVALVGIRLVVEVLRHLSSARPVLTSQRAQFDRRTHEVQPTTVSVVVPSFNPGDAIKSTVARIRAALTSAGMTCELIVVSDGSSDGTPQWLEECRSVDRHIWLRTNHGKGGALREGFSVVTGDVVCFIDADGDIDPTAIPSMAALVRSEKFDIVYGSKLHPESNVKMSWARSVVSWIFRSMARLLFRIDVHDTQSGVKAFRGDFVRSVQPLLRESGFNLDLEMFVLANELGYTRFAEHPIVLNRTGDSTIRLGTLFSMFWSTLSMFWRVRLALDYNELIETRVVSA